MVGIVKSKVLKSGAVGEFWKITKVNLDLLSGICVVTVSLYIDQASYLAGKAPLSMSKVFYLTVVPSDLASGADIRDIIWSKIKSKASSLVSLDLIGHSVADTYYDPDLVGGTDV